MTLNEVMEKIKKLMALGASPEPHEAAAAMRQAQKLMDKFNLDESLFELKAGKRELRSLVSVSKPAIWEGMLFQKLSKAFGCEVVWRRSHSTYAGSAVYGNYIFLGLDHRLEPTVYTAQVLQRKALSARSQYRTSLGDRLPRAELTRRLDGFVIGWVEQVVENLHEARLGEAEQRLVDDALSSSTSGSKATTRSRSVSATDVLAGRLAAKDVNVFTGVAGTAHRPLLTGG